MNNIKFCVIMPCYNSALYVKDAIDSLLNQKYQNWNLLAVNDGSTDSTLEILNSFARKDKRIRVFSKKNGGYSTAINYGLERVSGDYFLMLGSDDRLSEDLFSELVKNVENRDLPDIIGFRAMRYVDGKPYEIDGISNFETAAYMKGATINEFDKRYPRHSKIFFVRDTAKCFKTSLLGKLRYFGKYGYSADGVFSTLFARKCQSFLCVPIFGYYWTIRQDSVSATVDKNKNLDSIRVWDDFISTLNHYDELEITGQEKKYIFSPIIISIDLLNNEQKLSLYDVFVMSSAMRKTFVFAKKNNINLGIYELPKNIIKRTIFLMFPLMFLKRHGFLNDKKVMEKK